MMAREDWKVGDVLVKKWGENAGEKRTIRALGVVASFDDANALDVWFMGSRERYRQLDLIKESWALLKDPSNAHDPR